MYDSLVQFEPHVQTSKANRVARNHDPLALIAHSNASSSQSHANPSSLHSPQPYYVTHPSSVVDYEEDYQRELQGDSQEDKDSRVDIQTKNAGYGGNGNRNVGRQNRNQAFNAGNVDDNANSEPSYDAKAASEEDEIIYSQLDDARYDRALLRAQVNILYRDRPFHRRTALLKGRVPIILVSPPLGHRVISNRKETVVITDLLKAALFETKDSYGGTKDSERSHKTQMIELQRQQGPAKDPCKSQSLPRGQHIDEGLAVLATCATTRNGDDSHTSGTGVRRNERAVRECTYQDFMKCQPLFFRGTEERSLDPSGLDRMETRVRIRTAP
ncbi:hypothetical protein Tco_1080609 [Tanacetum coccineum]|uniref:Uncharacterized protein n=1 Tax=Tanacetum coccineum TaxID=301880 RepID=A0ABQ5HVE8_9ASTR